MKKIHETLLSCGASLKKERLRTTNERSGMFDWFPFAPGLGHTQKMTLSDWFHRLSQLELSEEVMERLFVAVRSLLGPLQQAAKHTMAEKEENALIEYHKHRNPFSKMTKHFSTGCPQVIHQIRCHLPKFVENVVDKQVFILLVFWYTSLKRKGI